MKSRIAALKTRLDSTEQPEQQVSLLHDIGWYSALGEDSAILEDSLTQAYRLIKQHNMPRTYNAAQDVLNAFLIKLQKGYPSGLKAALEIEIAYHGEIDNKWRMRHAFLLADLHVRTGNVNDAMVAYRTGYEIATSIDDAAGQYMGLNGIGLVYGHMDDTKNALHYFKIALELAQAHNLKDWIFTSYHNLCQVYLMLNDLDAAEHAAKEAMQIANSNTRVSAVSRIVLVYHARGAYDAAKVVLEDANAFYKENGGMWQSGMTLNRLLGENLIARGEAAAAIPLLERIIEESKQRGVLLYVMEAYSVLVRAYEQVGKYKLALEAHKNYFEIHREIHDERSKARMQSLEIMYHTREIETRLEHQQKMTRQAISRAEQTKQYFEELNNMKADFIDSATHDLKNPLASIRLNTDLLRRKIPATFHRHLDRVNHDADRMNLLIADMLDIARLETGQAIQPHLNVLNDLVHRVIATQALFAREKAILIDTRFPHDNLEFYFDEHYLDRCLGNLLSNAIKYSPDNTTISIEVELHDEQIQIQVIDQGYGIEQDNLERIFDRFYRVHDENNAKIEGTGLGLSIVQSIVEQHGGSISVESTVGYGTTFTILLPYMSQSRTVLTDIPV